MISTEMYKVFIEIYQYTDDADIIFSLFKNVKSGRKPQLHSKVYLRGSKHTVVLITFF